MARGRGDPLPGEPAGAPLRHRPYSAALNWSAGPERAPAFAAASLGMWILRAAGAVLSDFARGRGFWFSVGGIHITVLWRREARVLELELL
jgi:hypothetical protein